MKSQSRHLFVASFPGAALQLSVLIRLPQLHLDPPPLAPSARSVTPEELRAVAGAGGEEVGPWA